MNWRKKMQKIVRNLLFRPKFTPLESMIKIYECASDKDFVNNIHAQRINNCFKKYIEGLSKLGFKENIPYCDFIDPKPSEHWEFEDNNKILLLFSGGKDSTATAIDLREKGYNVTLYFLQGVNLSYSDELERAKVVAKKLNMPMIIDYISVTGKGDFLENPTKNQLILAYALNYGISHNIYTYCYGGFKEDTIEQSAFDRNFSDSIELFNWFESGIKRMIPQFNVITPFDNEVETLKLIGKYPELWNDFQSCLTPKRYREHLRKTNQEKYNVKLFDHRCGSCWKCCMEYIVFCDLGLVEYNEEFYKHCLDIFSNKLKEERPYAKPTKDLKELYMIWIESEELMKQSKFFNKE